VVSRYELASARVSAFVLGLSPTQARRLLRYILADLDGVEWDADAFQSVAEDCAAFGFRFAQPGDLGDDDESDESWEDALSDAEQALELAEEKAKAVRRGWAQGH